MKSVNRNDEAERLNPDKFIQEVGSDVQKTENWFCRQHVLIMDFLGGSILSILIGLLAAWIFRKIFLYLIGRYHAVWKWKILNALVKPVILLAVLIGCFFFSRPLLKTLPIYLYELDLRLFYASLVFAGAWGIFRLVSVLDQKIRRLAERHDNTLDNLTVSMIGNTLKIAIAVTAVLFIGQNIFNLNITALLASAGIIGLAVALAAKDTVSNFFGTIVIIADCPFRIGDRIESGKINGIVTHIGMRSSKIMTSDESIYTIPNNILTNSALCNINHRGCIKHVMEIGLTYDTAPEQMEKAIAILHEIMDDFHGPDARGQSPHIYFSNFGPYSLNIHAIIWLKTASFAEEEKLRNELNLAILKQFNAAGLNIAYPTQTLYIAGKSLDQ
ncbi:MAG: mechanosensitive ion channel family protein [Lentisphaeria bacterium]|nr:mechanosensitive ion channel family protein [Lentisphaeria bacterium]